MNTRYEELDSIRGIAAFMVLLSHIFFIFPNIGSTLNAKFGLFSTFFWNGHISVIMFFVLSGFVLSLPFYNSNKHYYTDYIIKRICRIYIPYIVILFIAIIFKIMFHSKIGNVPNLVNWGTWDNGNVNIDDILKHIFFLGEFNSDSFIMVIWSLVHEMRISFIFPLIILILTRLNIKLSIFIPVVLSTSSVFLIIHFPTKFNIPISTNYFITLHYTSMFIIGSLVAKYRLKLLNIKNSVKILIFFAGIVFFYFPGIPFKILSLVIGNVQYTSYQIYIDWMIAIGSSCLIITSLNSKIASNFLLFRPINFLGKISYSLYLVHPLVLLVSVYTLYGYFSVPLILIISLILSIVFSWLSYKFIELPSISLGKHLIGRKKLIIKVETPV
jgi:peptidoglycan/LPS O-acetylase OafA/YrhL